MKLDAMRRWWQALEGPPQPWTRPQVMFAVISSVVVAITRFAAVSLTPWDWDEALFMLGVRSYDVRLHHPHPPGFPLFIAAAKVFHAIGFSEFHAVQAVVVLSAMLLFPAALFLGYEARFSAHTTLGAAALLVFLPDVWFYGGTAFSDVPSTLLAMLAVALFLRSCRSPLALVAGAVVLGAAAGVRVQTLLIAFVPALIGVVFSLRRHRAALAAAMVAGAFVLGGAYGLAAHYSGGWSAYRAVVREHADYMRDVDSFHNPTRGPLRDVALDFFFHPYGAPRLNVPIAVFAALSLLIAVVRPRPEILVLLAAFGPFCFLAWIYLDRLGASRFAVAWAPMLAFLVADGVRVVSLGMRPISVIVLAVLIGTSVSWTWPALREVRRHPSPPWSAMQWLRAHAATPPPAIFVHVSVDPFADTFLTGIPSVRTKDAVPSGTQLRSGDLFVEEGVQSNAIVFSRPRQPLARLVRDRYFDVSIAPLRELFEDGWYDPEGSAASNFRWMSGRGHLVIPPADRAMTMRLRFFVPIDSLSAAPVVTLLRDGEVVERVTAAKPELLLSCRIPPHPKGNSEVLVATSATVNPAAQHLSDDSRNLGLRLDAIEWSD